jgi:hypothetical protein
MRSAKPASTVPVIQRWALSHAGRAARNPVIEPAVNAISTWTLALMTICIVPNTSDCSSTLPRAGSMNCGNSASYSIAIFGFRRLVTKPIINSLRGLSTGNSRT